MSDDFETARWALHYYGDTIPNDREPLAEGDAALSRIQAEVERLRAGSEGFIREMARLDAEVERLREENKFLLDRQSETDGAATLAWERRVKVAEAEVERLRELLDDAETERDMQEVEVERLREVLEQIAGEGEQAKPFLGKLGYDWEQGLVHAGDIARQALKNTEKEQAR